MPRGAPAIKLAVTVDRGVHARVVRAAREDKMSVSAWMTDAARQALRIRDGLAGIAEWEAEHGPLTDRELEEARQRVRQKHMRRPASHRSRAR